MIEQIAPFSPGIVLAGAGLWLFVGFFISILRGKPKEAEQWAEPAQALSLAAYLLLLAGGFFAH